MFDWLFGRKDQGEGFWTWFQENESILWAVSGPDEALFGELSARLRRVAEGLAFEFGPVEEGRREFVISAEGVLERFPAVTALVAQAPAMERWKIVAFRQPGKSSLRLEMPTGFAMDPADVSVALDMDAGKPGITLFLPGYTEEPEHIRQSYLTAGFLFLDNTLGEYTVATQVGEIAFRPLHASRGVETMKLSDLPAHFSRSEPAGADI